ncbi:MAG: M1 family metallopeptidase [Gammaproteobacteria bacterium]|nr:M1 family metallopeptidase [Gammaproteobacteria bacterium]
MLPKLAVALVGTLVLSSCTQDAYDPGRDYFSFANSDQFVTHHLDLDLTVDFDARQLAGSVRLSMKRLDPVARELVLDSRALHIESVSVALPDGSERDAGFRIGASDKILGEPLTISLPDGFDPDPAFSVTIHYRTDPGATALQWLPPELTAGGKHPFLFSQSQDIHARSWIPLQDTPSVRVSYAATIRTPPELLALMSAENDPLTVRSGEYRFKMPQPIPSYLLAIAVGDLFFAPLGPQTGVYAEPEVLAAAAYEFADTQHMLDAAAEMYGDYQWGRYDLLILPPSFPYGGMENPRLSFITPTILAGDRSLVSLIAHELAHSWSGNLVSNQTWRGIWLNEGVTSYLDKRLMEVLFGKERADEERVIDYRELIEQLPDIEPEMQALAPRLSREDIEKTRGTVYYKKGQLLLEYLEHAFGRDVFDEFLAAYFAHFRFQAITSEQFLGYLKENLLDRYPGKVSQAQVEQWLYQPGLPDDAVIPQSESLRRAAGLALQWAGGEVPLESVPLADWSSHAVVHFINSLPDTLGNEQLMELDQSNGLSSTRNAEISRAWFIQVAKRRYQPAYESMQRHLIRYGRMRLVVPVYKALVENGQDQALAEEIFALAKPGYHPITIMAAGSVLGETAGP